MRGTERRLAATNLSLRLAFHAEQPIRNPGGNRRTNRRFDSPGENVAGNERPSPRPGNTLTSRDCDPCTVTRGSAQPAPSVLFWFPLPQAAVQSGQPPEGPQRAALWFPRPRQDVAQSMQPLGHTRSNGAKQSHKIMGSRSRDHVRRDNHPRPSLRTITGDHHLGNALAVPIWNQPRRFIGKPGSPAAAHCRWRPAAFFCHRRSLPTWLIDLDAHPPRSEMCGHQPTGFFARVADQVSPAPGEQTLKQGAIRGGARSLRRNGSSDPERPGLKSFGKLQRVHEACLRGPCGRGDFAVQPAAFRATRKKAIADQLRFESYPCGNICQFKSHREYRLPHGIPSTPFFRS